MRDVIAVIVIFTWVPVDWLTVLVVCCIAIFLIVVIILSTLYVISYRQKQKKKYNFGVKKPKNTVMYRSLLLCSLLCSRQFIATNVV